MSDTTPSRQNGAATSCQFNSRLKSAGWLALHHVRKHTGVGIICSVAYFDPGNWGVDLQAGSQFGYRLLFVVLLAGLFAVFLQALASRLGCVTGVDLAAHCRLLLYNRPKHTLLYRWLGLYPLYAISEIAIVSTDLAEMLGSAIALCLLFPKLEVWQGVLITAFDVVLLLALGNPLQGRPLKAFEFLIAGLVFAVLICMLIIISRVEVNWQNAFEGFLPSKYIFQKGGLYTSVGILGATVMPHSLFLGSTLATQDRLSSAPPSEKFSRFFKSDSKQSLDVQTVQRLPRWRRLVNAVIEFIAAAFRLPPPGNTATMTMRHGDRENNSLEFIRAHIYHGVADVVGSLLGVAVLINALILALASAVFFTSGDGAQPASLFDAYDLIRNHIGQGAATLFAIALLASGQSSSIIATVAGQAVAEGFLQWRVSAVVRRLLTRLIAVIPSMVVAIAVGRSGINVLLVVSQVILSIILPFITLPLLYFTSTKTIMQVRKPTPNSSSIHPGETAPIDTQARDPAVLESAGDEMVDFSNGKVTIVVGGVIWLVILTANVYVIVTLALGQGS